MNVLRRKRGKQKKPIAHLSNLTDAVESAKASGLRYVSDDMRGITRKRSGKGFHYLDPQGRPLRDAEHLRRHAADPMPPELQEFRGAEDPQREKVLEDQLKEKQNRWGQDARKAAVPLIEQAQSLLQQAGVRADRIESRV